MLIRSQDKTELINLSNIIRISVECKSVTVEAINEIPKTIGYYSSGEKALKVLDMIQGHCNSYKVQQTFPNECGYVVEFTFNMPQEDEI